MKLDDCLRIINRHIQVAREEVSRRQRQGLQFRPWQHRIEELETVRREIAALSTPEALRVRPRDGLAPLRREPPGIPAGSSVFP